MKQDNYPVAVYCINPKYDTQNDYRLNFLKNQGITVELIYNAFDQKLNSLQRIMRSLFLWFFAKARIFDSHYQEKSLFLSRLAQLIFEIIGVVLYELTRVMFYHKKWAYYVLEQTGAQALCFDHIIPRRYVVEVLLKAAKKMSISTIALPHGVYLYTNEFTKAKATVSRRFNKFNRFDYIVVQNQLRKDVLSRAGVARERIFVLGSARFCNEWLQQNSKILPRMIDANMNSTGKLKLVFMPSKPRCRIDVERMHNTIEILASHSEVEAVVKPHTRTGRESHLFADMPLANVSNVLTPELCEWADVMLVIGSSVMTEALMQDKPVLYLKYLHANTTLFEEYGACWTLHNEAELEQALQSLKGKRLDVPYQAENVNRYVKEVVYGGQNKRDVLRDYVEFITSRTVN
jgi:hypothetical protein